MLKFLLIGLLVGVAALRVQAESVDVFLFAGQSNASGRVNTGYVANPNDAQVRYYYQTDGPAATDVTSGAFTTLAPLASGYYGPEISMGRELVDLGYNPAIIKVSDGGTTLASNWNSRTNGNWWNNWKGTTASALSQLTGQGHTVRLRGFFWLQGETDAGNQTFANNYQTNFQNLTADVSSYLSVLGYNVSELAYVTALIHNPSGSAQYVNTVRTAQQNVMNAKANAAWFDTNDLVTPDNLHFNAAGVQAIGERFASSYDSIPEPSSALVLLGIGGLALRRRLR